MTKGTDISLYGYLVCHFIVTNLGNGSKLKFCQLMMNNEINVYMYGWTLFIYKEKQIIKFEGKSKGLEAILSDMPLHQKYKSHMSSFCIP